MWRDPTANQPAEETARSISGVGSKPLRLKIETTLGSVEHRLCRFDFVIGARRRWFNVDNDSVLDVDEIIALLWQISRARDSQISFSVTHGWSVFGGADHGLQDVVLEKRAWTLAQAVSGSIGSQSTTTNVPALRVWADRTWRSQERAADGSAGCAWRVRSIAPLHRVRGLGCRAGRDRTAGSSRQARR